MSTKFLEIFIRFVIKIVNYKVDVPATPASEKFKDFGEKKSITKHFHNLKLIRGHTLITVACRGT